MTSLNLRRSHWRFPILAPILAVAIALATVGVAFAHANLVRSDPAAGASLPTSPAKVQLWFTEPLEPSFSDAVVYDANQQRVDQNDSHVDPTDPESLILNLKPNLPKGTYAIAWKTQSKVDGHVVRGIVPFGVGVASVAVSSAASENVVQGEVSGSPVEMALRWLGLLGLTGLVGVAWFWRMQERLLRSFASRANNPAALRQPVSPRDALLPAQRVIASLLAVILVVAVALLLLQDAAVSANSSLLGALGAPVAQLAVATQYGQLLVARVILGVVLLVIYLRWNRGQIGPLRLDLAALGVGALLLLTTSLSSHSAAIGSFSPLTIANDWLHLGATAIWVGGLLQLLVLVPALSATRPGPNPGAPFGPPFPAREGGAKGNDRAAWDSEAESHAARSFPLAPPSRAGKGGPKGAPGLGPGRIAPVLLASEAERDTMTAAPTGLSLATLSASNSLRYLGALIYEFGRVGTIALAILGLTGLVEAYVHVGTLDNLATTDYGQALLVKILLILPLLALAAVNHFVFRPTLSRARAAASAALLARVRDLAHALAWTVRLEVLFAVAVIAAAGVMTSLSPAHQFGAATPGPLTLTASAGDLNLAFTLAPGKPGPNQYAVDVRDRSGAIPSTIQQVSLRLTYLDQDLGTSEVVLTRSASGRYEGQSSDLAVAGRWEADAIVRRAGQDDVTARYGFNLTDNGAQGIGDVPLQVSPQFYLGLVLAAIGVLALVRGRQLRADLRRAAVLAICGIGLIGAGGYVSFQDVQTAQAQAAAATVALRHPPTAQSIANGALVFRQNCAVCHGLDARGDGPMAPSLNPPPSNLIVHVPLHPDADLEYWIANGFPGSAMPAFQNKLTEDQRWDVLNYLKSLVSAANGGSAANSPPSAAPAGAAASAPAAVSPGAAASAASSSTATNSATTPAPANGTPLASAPASAPPSPTALPTPRPTPLGGGLAQSGAIGDLRAQVQIQPKIYEPAVLQLRLTDAAGQTPTDVRQVEFQVAMEGMNHGARGIAATAVGAGVYQAQGLILAMEGPWWLAVRVERADGRTDSAVFAFQVPRQYPSGAVSAMYTRPNASPQVVDVAVYPAELAPEDLNVRAGLPIRLEVLEVDRPACNASVRFDALGKASRISSDGVAELDFTPDRDGTIRLTCAPSTLTLAYAPSP